LLIGLSAIFFEEGMGLETINNSVDFEDDLDREPGIFHFNVVNITVHQ